jgi:hypothetical protein
MGFIQFSIKLEINRSKRAARKRLNLGRLLSRMASALHLPDFVGAAVWLLSPNAYRQACKLYKVGLYENCISTLLPLTQPGLEHPPALFRRGLAESKLNRWGASHASIAAACKRWPWRKRWERHLKKAKIMDDLYDSCRPEVILYLSGTNGTAYQGNMWIPVMEALDARVAIVAREKHIVSGLMKTKIPIFFMSSMRDLEHFESMGTKTVLYPANTQKNTQMLRFAGMNHFFINHGESDKVVNQSKFLMAYDKLLVAGPLAEQRLKYAKIPLRQGQVEFVGRPPLEFLLERPEHFQTPIKKVLYAPTWEGFVEAANYSSVSSFGFNMLDTLAKAERFEVVFKAHVLTGSKKPTTKKALRQINAFCRRHKMRLATPNDSIYPLMNEADLLITDVSSTIPDFLYTRKPMVLTNPQALGHQELNLTFPSSKATYIIDDPRQIVDLLARIEANDEMLMNRQEICSYVLGNPAGGSFATFNRIINESIGFATATDTFDTAVSLGQE